MDFDEKKKNGTRLGDGYLWVLPKFNVKCFPVSNLLHSFYLVLFVSFCRGKQFFIFVFSSDNWLYRTFHRGFISTAWMSPDCNMFSWWIRNFCSDKTKEMLSSVSCLISTEVKRGSMKPMYQSIRRKVAGSAARRQNPQNKSSLFFFLSFPFCCQILQLQEGLSLQSWTVLSRGCYSYWPSPRSPLGRVTFFKDFHWNAAQQPDVPAGSEKTLVSFWWEKNCEEEFDWTLLKPQAGKQLALTIFFSPVTSSVNMSQTPCWIL